MVTDDGETSAHIEEKTELNRKIEFTVEHVLEPDRNYFFEFFKITRDVEGNFKITTANPDNVSDDARNIFNHLQTTLFLKTDYYIERS